MTTSVFDDLKHCPHCCVTFDLASDAGVPVGPLTHCPLCAVLIAKRGLRPGPWMPHGGPVAPYAFDTVLGVGGFGIVYRGTDTELAIPVVAKCLLGNLFERDPTYGPQELVREARTGAQVVHPASRLTSASAG